MKVVEAMLSSPIFARVAFYPSLLWGIATESSTKRWYDRIDTHLILGALPFKSQTKEVSTTTKSTLIDEGFVLFVCYCCLALCLNWRGEGLGVT